jgi:hypothetical protein
MKISSVLRKTALGFALVGVVGVASAGSYDFGTLNTTVSASSPEMQIFGDFDDTFSFIAGPLPGVLGGIVGIDGVGNLTAQYRFGVGATAAWGDWSASAPVPSDSDGNFSYSATFGGLTSGQTYWFEVQGNATVATYTVTLAPVPEPETYAMFLAGLGLMGAVARRRNSVSRG